MVNDNDEMATLDIPLPVKLSSEDIESLKERIIVGIREEYDWWIRDRIGQELTDEYYSSLAGAALNVLKTENIIYEK